jgi:deuterolysin
LWDVAPTHDLGAGGEFQIHSAGQLLYAEANSTSISGAISYISNTVTANIDGIAATKSRRAFDDLYKRQIIATDCKGEKLAAVKTSLAACASLAAVAEKAAREGPDNKMKEYFKSSDSKTRKTVATVFNLMQQECSGGTDAKQFCTDVGNDCSPGVLAYTSPRTSTIVNCPSYFKLPSLTSRCHRDDQVTTTMHETTHLKQIKGTSDMGGCYGYSCTTHLPGKQNINHADTYCLFANGK